MTHVRQLAISALDGQDLLPLASLDCEIDRIGKVNGIQFQEESDDLDAYQISALQLEGAEAPAPFVFALRAYRRAPNHAVDILLPAELLGSPRVRKIATDIASALHVPAQRVNWPERGTESARRDRDERRRAS